MFHRGKFRREEGGVYVHLRPIAVVSRLLGIFPVGGVLRKNGRQLTKIPFVQRKGRYLATVHPAYLWDFALALTLTVNICSIFFYVEQLPIQEMNQQNGCPTVAPEVGPGVISMSPHQNRQVKMPGIIHGDVTPAVWNRLKTSRLGRHLDYSSTGGTDAMEYPGSESGDNIPQNPHKVLPAVGSRAVSAFGLGHFSPILYKKNAGNTVRVRKNGRNVSSRLTNVIFNISSSDQELGGDARLIQARGFMMVSGEIPRRPGVISVNLGKSPSKPTEKRLERENGQHLIYSLTDVISNEPSISQELRLALQSPRARDSAMVRVKIPNRHGVISAISRKLSLKPTKYLPEIKSGQHPSSSFSIIISNSSSTYQELVRAPQFSKAQDPSMARDEIPKIPGELSVILEKLSIKPMRKRTERRTSKVRYDLGKTDELRDFIRLTQGYNDKRNKRAYGKRDVAEMWQGSSDGRERFSNTANASRKKNSTLIKNASIGFTFMGIVSQALLFVVARIHSGRSFCLIALMEDLSDALGLLERVSRAKRRKIRTLNPRIQRRPINIIRDTPCIPRVIIGEETNLASNETRKDLRSCALRKIAPASFPFGYGSQKSERKCERSAELGKLMIREETNLAKNEIGKGLRCCAPQIIPPASNPEGDGSRRAIHKSDSPVVAGLPNPYVNLHGRSVRHRIILSKFQNLRSGWHRRQRNRGSEGRFIKEPYTNGVATRLLFDDTKEDQRNAVAIWKTGRNRNMCQFRSRFVRRNALNFFPTVSIIGYLIFVSWLIIFYWRFFVIGDPPFPTSESRSEMVAYSGEGGVENGTGLLNNGSILRDDFDVGDGDSSEKAPPSGTNIELDSKPMSGSQPHWTHQKIEADSVVKPGNGEGKVSGSEYASPIKSIPRNSTDVMPFGALEKSIEEIKGNPCNVIMFYQSRVRPQVFLWIASATITSSYFYLHVVQVLFFLFEASALFERVNVLIMEQLEQYIGMDNEEIKTIHQERDLTGTSGGFREKHFECSPLHARLETLRLLRASICSLIMGMEAHQVVHTNGRGITIRKSVNKIMDVGKNPRLRVLNANIFAGTSLSNANKYSSGQQTDAETVVQAPLFQRMRDKRKGMFQTLRWRRRLHHARMSGVWRKRQTIERPLDLQERLGFRRHDGVPLDYRGTNRVDLPSCSEGRTTECGINDALRTTLAMGMLISPNYTVGEVERNRLAATMDSLPSEESQIHGRDAYFKEKSGGNTKWLKEIRRKLGVMTGKNIFREKRIGNKVSFTIKVTKKDTNGRIHSSPSEKLRCRLHRQVAFNSERRNKIGPKISWMGTKDSDAERESRSFSQPCPCGSLTSCGRVRGVNGCQGSIILFLTMKSLVDILLAFTVSIARGFMTGWQIPLQFFRIVGMATVALAATSLSEKARAGIWMMHAVRLDDLDEKSANQLKQLIVQLTASHVEVTAAGYFSLTKGFLISILSVIATYVIIIIQFKLSEA